MPIKKWWKWTVALWRRSLQVRVVGTTLLLASVVLFILNFLVMGQIVDELIATHRAQALEEVERGKQYAVNQLNTLGDSSDPALDGTLRAVVANLSDAGVQAGRFAVMIGASNPRLPAIYVAHYEPDNVQIPSELANLVATKQVLAYQYTRTSLGETPSRPFLVVSTPLESVAGSFTLSYLFPLDTEQATIDVVRKALIGMAFLLAVLLAGIVYVVTLQVVNPVQMAAVTAEKLAAGLLEQRMEVRGEDELARLGRSFNHMAANLQHQIVRLEELSRMQQRFTSDVSHELRTPLTTIRMASDVMHNHKDSFTPAVARSAELLTRELDRFEALLADLLEISRYDSGAAVLAPEETLLGPLLERVVSNLEPLAERNDTPILLRVPSAPVSAEVDSRRIERIIRNLAGNALEYGAGKPVAIHLAANDVAAAVTVRDYGLGFSPEQAETVFNRFWRADPSRARTTGGTGLGLAIAAEDAQLHSGRLEAWGRLNHGAQFRLTIPLKAGTVIDFDDSPLPLKPNDVEAEEPSQ